MKGNKNKGKLKLIEAKFANYLSNQTKMTLPSQEQQIKKEIDIINYNQLPIMSHK